MSSLVQIFLVLAGAYAGLGLAFAIPFVLCGASQLAPAARGATWGFRLIVLPGAAALWPWLAGRWLRGTVSEERNAHRDRASVRSSGGQS